MMYGLWPDEFDGKLDEGETIFVSESDGKLIGFIALSIRNWVEGASIAPSPHVEGWYVDPEFRGKGIGTELMKAGEKWAADQGFKELTSDVEMENSLSLKVHEALGFEPTSKIQYFRKNL